jgi:hypothetical protein
MSLSLVRQVIDRLQIWSLLLIIVVAIINTMAVMEDKLNAFQADKTAK